MNLHEIHSLEENYMCLVILPPFVWFILLYIILIVIPTKIQPAALKVSKIVKGH